jgi:lysine 6-dehydrogenase
MSYTYAVTGSGRQGTAAGYELARWGQATQVIMGDKDLEVAQRSAERINRLIGRSIAEARQVDVTDPLSVRQGLHGVDAFLSAVPYYYNLELTRSAIEMKVSMADLGGNTDIARQQHTFDPQARLSGISIIPDCGQVPGLGTSLCVYAMSLLDEPVDVYMWDGGIPQQPRPPFHYLLTFHIAGLTNEYAEPAVFLRDWKIQEIEPMTELEGVEFPQPIGQLEAFVAGGGTSSMPWTFAGKLRTLQNLTLRYPGNYAQLRAFWDLGLWSQEPIQIGEQKVAPRDVFHALFEPKVVFPGDKDLVIVRVKALGVKNGQAAEAVVELIDYYDDATGFTAMERATGWSAAIVAEMAAQGATPRGAGGVEAMVPAAAFVEALRQRGLNVTEKVTSAMSGK